MHLDLSEVPEPVSGLVPTLEAEGFELVAQRGDGTVNRLIELRRGSFGVRITADRGQWWIELGGPDLADWFDPDIWEACLDDVPVEMEPSGLQQRVDVVRARWREAADRLDSSPEIKECLDRKRSTRARTRLGLPPRYENGSG